MTHVLVLRTPNNGRNLLFPCFACFRKILMQKGHIYFYSQPLVDTHSGIALLKIGENTDHVIKEMLTRVWSAQHPNGCHNIQHLLSFFEVHFGQSESFTIFKLLFFIFTKDFLLCPMQKQIWLEFNFSPTDKFFPTLTDLLTN